MDSNIVVDDDDDDDSLMIQLYSDDGFVRTASESILPVVTAFISIASSYIILREVFRDHRAEQRQRGGDSPSRNSAIRLPLSRVLAAMSLADIIFSIGLGLSTFVSPNNVEYLEWSFGNTRTCELQGFMIQFGQVSSALFCAVLAFFYLLIIKYRWTDDKLQRLEWWNHAGVWLFTLAVSIFPIPTGLYNSSWGICWLESFPEGCKDSLTFGEEEANCTRGDNAHIYALAFTIFPSWVCLVLYIVFMVVLYQYVRGLETNAYI